MQLAGALLFSTYCIKGARKSRDKLQVLLSHDPWLYKALNEDSNVLHGKGQSVPTTNHGLLEILEIISWKISLGEGHIPDNILWFDFRLQLISAVCEKNYTFLLQGKKKKKKQINCFRHIPNLNINKGKNSLSFSRTYRRRCRSITLCTVQSRKELPSVEISWYPSLN